MVAVSTSKKQLIWLTPILLILVVMGVNIHLDNQKPYKEISFGEKQLFVPKNMLQKSEPDLVNMVRDHLSQTITNRLQLVQYADELLPDIAPKYGTASNSSIIWTIEPLTTIPAQSQPVMTMDAETGLYKTEGISNSGSIQYADHPTAPTWIATCIEFRAIRPGDSWGRCSYDYEDNGFLIRLHFDGRLIRETGMIASASQALLRDWLQQPK